MCSTKIAYKYGIFANIFVLVCYISFSIFCCLYICLKLYAILYNFAMYIRNNSSTSDFCTLIQIQSTYTNNVCTIEQSTTTNLDYVDFFSLSLSFCLEMRIFIER